MTLKGTFALCYNSFARKIVEGVKNNHVLGIVENNENLCRNLGYRAREGTVDGTKATEVTPYGQ